MVFQNPRDGEQEYVRNNGGNSGPSSAVSNKMHANKKEDMAAAIKPILEFNKTPKQIKEETLDPYIIGQEEGKKSMSIAIANHYNRLGRAIREEMQNNGSDLDKALSKVETAKANVILIGPSGVGKTYTAETASKQIKVPFVKEDMTKFSETGYVGQDVSSILTDLLTAAQDNPYLASMGIVYLDEIDKNAGSRNLVGRDVSGKGVQNCLLKMVEGTDNTVEYKGQRIKLSTKNVLFIASGAFEGLETQVKNDLTRKGVTLQEGQTWEDYLTTEHLISYGMERQLMGRFPVRSFYHPLTTDDLVEIMKKETSDNVLKAYEADFANWGIDMKVEDDALKLVAQYAEREGTGARGLVSILDRVLRQDMYDLPGSDIKEIVLDENKVKERLRI
jgi:ATP-dependent Clp protease ATP-binding subunit ClpX